MTALGTIVFKDIPPYVLAAGNTAVPHGINVRGLKRRQFAPATIDALRHAYKVIYKSGFQVSDALERLASAAREHPEVGHLKSFIESSDRGIVR